MGRFLRKIMILVVMIGLAAWGLDVLFTAVFQRGRTVKAQWIHALHGQQYDVALIGGSRAWWNIDGTTIDTVCGARSINLANNHYTNLETLLSLELFLAKGNTVGQVLYQVDLDRLDADQEEFSSTVYDHLPFLDDSLTYAFLNARSSEWRAYRHIPFLRYTKFNFRWGLEEVLLGGLGLRSPIFDSTGSHFLDQPFRGTIGFVPGERRYVMNDDLLQLRDLCADNGIQLHLFMAPYLDLRAPAGTRERIAQLLHEHGFTFHDFSDRLREKAFYNDRKHLSVVGGREFTRILTEEVICPGPLNVEAVLNRE